MLEERLFHFEKIVSMAELRQVHIVFSGHEIAIILFSELLLRGTQRLKIHDVGTVPDYLTNR